jgi:hypothetical protein
MRKIDYYPFAGQSIGETAAVKKSLVGQQRAGDSFSDWKI